MAIKDTVEQLITPSVESLGYTLWAVEYVQGKESILRIYIDHPEGIVLDDCVAVSEQVGAILDVEDPIGGEYNLEVSSPGLERELFKIEHYKQFIGSKVKMKLLRPVQQSRALSGTIVAVADDIVVIKRENEELELDIHLINKAHLVIDL